MQESLWKILMFVIMIALLVVYPILQMWEMQESMLQVEVTNIVAELLDEVRYSKRITSARFSVFLNTLSKIDKSIEVELKHKIAYWVPELDLMGNTTGEAHQALMEIGHEEIVERMNLQNSGAPNVNPANGALVLQEGDWFEIKAMSTNKTKSQILRELIWRVPMNYARYYVKLSGTVH